MQRGAMSTCKWTFSVGFSFNLISCLAKEYWDKIVPSRSLLLTLRCMVNGDIWICLLLYFFSRNKTQVHERSKGYRQGLCSWQYVDASWQSSSPAPGLLPCLPPAVDILNWWWKLFSCKREWEWRFELTYPINDTHISHVSIFWELYQCQCHQPLVPLPVSFQQAQSRAGLLWIPGSNIILVSRKFYYKSKSS